MLTLITLSVTSLAAFFACIASARNFFKGYVDNKVDESTDRRLLRELVARVEQLENERQHKR